MDRLRELLCQGWEVVYQDTDEGYRLHKDGRYKWIDVDGTEWDEL